MEKERNPNFIYMYAEAVEQEIAISKKTGDIFCADGVRYSAAEVALIASGEVPVTLKEHAIKKLFNGEIVGYERKAADDKREFVKNGGAESPDNAKSYGGKVAPPPAVGVENGSGELDIY
ncbi:MAG: hypothetical protein FWC97_00465 [Treponema sp.]|nr:hypothetical protein [Treponema sp.]